MGDTSPFCPKLMAAKLELIEAEYLAYARMTPDKQAALEALAATSGFRQWWHGAATTFESGFARHVEQLLAST